MATLLRDNVTEDVLVGKYMAFSDMLAKLERPDTPVLSAASPNLKNLRTKDGMVPYGQRTYKYKERQYLHGRTTLNGAVAQAATTVVLTDKVCRPGDIVIVGDEAILLTSSSDYLTFTSCTRSVFTGADVAHADGDDVFVFGTSYAESQNSPTASAIPQATEVTTYTDIIMESFKISGSAEEVGQYAEDWDKVIEFGYEIMIQGKKQLQQRLVWSDAQAPVGETTAGRMDGIYERVAATNYISVGSASVPANLEYAHFQEGIRKCTRKGASGPFMFFMNDYQGHQIDTWIQPYAQVQSSELAQSIFGSHVRSIRVGAHVLDLIATDEMSTHGVLTTINNIRVGPKSPKRTFHLEKLGTSGDYQQWMLVGEYTCEVALAYSHCWYFHTKLN